MNAVRRLAFAEKWTGPRETLYVAEEDEPPLSRTRPRYSGGNFILDGRIRIEPKGHPHYLEDRRQWVMWGYQWNGQNKSWSDLRLFHCRGFELEDEPI